MLRKKWKLEKKKKKLKFLTALVGFKAAPYILHMYNQTIRMLMKYSTKAKTHVEPKSESVVENRTGSLSVDTGKC